MSIQRRKLKDKLARLTLWIVLLLVTATLLGILGFLVARGYSALSWEFFTEPPRNGMTEGGILTPLVGTLQLIIVSMAFAFPVGVLTAIYLHEYALDNATTRSIRLAIRCLAGVPSLSSGCSVSHSSVFFLNSAQTCSPQGSRLAASHCPSLWAHPRQRCKMSPGITGMHPSA